MAPVRLRSEPSVLALVLDVVVFALVLPGALSVDNATWIRLICFALAAAALVLGARSATLLARR